MVEEENSMGQQTTETGTETVLAPSAVQEEERSVLDAVFPDGDSHSPDAASTQASEEPVETETKPPEKSSSEEAVTEPDSGKSLQDHVSEEVPEENLSRHQQEEIERLHQRLHDTQSAMHKAMEERAELRKKLDDLEKKKASEDDFFSDEDANSEAEVISKINENDKLFSGYESAVKNVEQRMNIMRWDEQVERVRKDCPDFEKVVYDGFAPLIDELTGDPEVLNQWKRKLEELESSGKPADPKTIYEFAKGVIEVEEFRRDPQAYREKILQDWKRASDGENRHGISESERSAKAEGNFPTGKTGLDMVNSAVGTSSSTMERSVLDEVFPLA